MTEYNAAVDHRIRVKVSHASRLPALAEFLRRAGCTVDRVGGRTLAVRVDAARDEETAKEQIDAYLRAWAARAPDGVRARRVPAGGLLIFAQRRGTRSPEPL
jgi:hypothetical protein